MLAFLLAITGCTNNPGSPFAPTPPAGVGQLAAQLADALSAGTIGGLALTGDAERAETDYQQAMSAMSGLLPEVDVGEIGYDGKQTADTASTLERAGQIKSPRVEVCECVGLGVCEFLDEIPAVIGKRVVCDRCPVIGCPGV